MGEPKEPSDTKKAATISWSLSLALLFIFGALVLIGSTKATGTSVNGLIQKVRPASPAPVAPSPR
jgi:hypothetical protein